MPVPNPASSTKTVALLASVWQRNLPVLRDRLALLDRAAALAAERMLTAPLRRDAAMTAHKLAGSLGMFGYGEASRVARVLEELLDAPDAPPVAQLLRLTGELRASLPL